MTRKCKLIVIAVVLPVLAYAGWAVCVRLCCSPVKTNSLVGCTEGQILGDYGQPDKDWQGYESLALQIPQTLPRGPVRTLIFHPRGILHPEGGTLWVWITQSGGEWVCFESCWFADGVVFRATIHITRRST